MFGRRRKKSEKAGAADTAEVSERPSSVHEPAKPEDHHRHQGPWDASEDVPEASRLDLGSLRVPVESGIEVQVNVAQQQDQIIGATLVHAGTAIQVQPFAAPKSSGLWEEMREELRTQITGQGGKVDDFEGTFGPELRAVIPVEGKKNEQGNQLGQRVRFLGVDGPRWILRAVIRGEGASKPEAMAQIEEIFAKVVVVRGDDPVPPRDLLKITVPPEVQQSMTKAKEQAAQRSADGEAGEGPAAQDADGRSSAESGG